MLLAVVPGVMCILKAKYWTSAAGIFLGLFWPVGAIRLAKPRSWPAATTARLARAVERHGS